MDAFALAPQQDEGYSEDPLNPSAAASSHKRRCDGIAVSSPSRSGAEIPPWLMRHIAGLSMQERTNLAMALLGDLPTDLVAQVVKQLNPRLYIDFIHYLPPEVCLKILGYLDPVSLIHVAQACRSWYDLALDRKLWQKLYFLEGWKAMPAEIEAWEAKANEDSTPRKRAAPTSPQLDADLDMVMADADGATRQETVDLEMAETSIFGGPARARSRAAQHLGELGMGSYGANDDHKGKGVDKGKGKLDWPMELGPEEFSREIPKSTLEMWVPTDGKYKINWKYLYTMRRRLESNWELGKFVNFQFPHPDFPEEGHGECIYSVQYDSQYLVSGSRDRTVRIWNVHTQRLTRPPLLAHSGSVLCLQFDSDPDEDLIVSGSSDSSVVIWRFSTGKVMQRLRHAHREPVLNVKFDKRVLVTCSKDKTIKIFNRRPLHPRDLGYPQVDLVPRTVKDYAYELTLDRLPVIKPFTLIGCLEGHGAAVNAVQVHDREVVSASGDRHIKMWDWPTQVCTRTFVGHHKGIACIQYDGRRIVSGSSDNEVKVFDRHTGLEVAALRSHCSLVRTVQAGFGDLPYSVDSDAAEARRVDAEYFKALEAGQLDDSEGPRQHLRRQGNAGSSRPEDIVAYGARLPPGGGGGKYGRIVSGSYDTSIIIWRRDKEGVWKDQHRLKQEDAAAAALRRGRSPQPPIATAAGLIPLHPTILAPVRQPLNPPTSSAAGPSAAAPTAATPSVDPNISPPTQSTSAPPASGRPATPTNQSDLQITQVESPIYATLTPSSIASYRQMIDAAVPQGPQALAQALASYPTMLTQRSHLQTAIDREQSPFVKSQLRQVVNTSLFRTQFEQARQRRDAIGRQQQQAAGAATGTANGDGNGGEGSSTAQAQTQQAAPASADTTTSTAAQATQPTATSTTTTQSQGQPADQAATGSGAAPPATAAAAASHQAHAPPLPPNPPAAAAATQAHAPGVGAHHPHIAAAAAAAAADANAPRVFKLQFDARRIICCSQTSVIVGWDFCNGDAELERASRFFATVE